MDTSTYNICQPSNGQEDDWRILYEGAFPVEERMPVADVRQHLANGTMWLHKTLNKANECLCFSLIFPINDFVLLSYIATDATKRSGGVGSKHLRRLVEICKAHNPSYLAMFLEIEATTEPGLDPATLKARQRRLSFYTRLGARRLCRNYMLPSLTPGHPHKPGELLWFEFSAHVVDDTILPRVIQEIYQKAYGLPVTDPMVQQVLGQFAQGTAGTICPPSANPAGGGTPTPPPAPSGGQPDQPPPPSPSQVKGR